MAKPGRWETVDRSSVPQRTLLLALNVLLGAWFLVWTVVIFIVCLPFFFPRPGLGSGEAFRLSLRRFIQFYGRSIIRLFRPVIRLKVENVSALKPVQPCVYVLNHFSFIDVFFCGFLPGRQTVIAIRSWPFKIPIFTYLMRGAGYMDVETGRSEDILSRAARALRSGACLLFFPEGHRSRNGRLQPFYKGAFRIAALNGVPVVPVTIEGTENLGGFRCRMLKPSRVRMRFFPPLEAEGSGPGAILKLMRQVETLYRDEVSLYRRPAARPASGK